MAGIDPATWAATIAIALFAGFVKGAIGFAMPMIMMSGLASFLPKETALALLVLPTLFTNLAQSLRDGPALMVESLSRYRWHIGMVALFLCISAQFVTSIPDAAMNIILGVPIVAFALWQLAGLPLSIPLVHRRRAEIGLGIVGGLYGGISGIWGPPLLVYLLSIDAPKSEMIRVQGVVFLIGAVTLIPAHLWSGVLTATTLALSAAATLPAMIGLWVGFRLQERLDQQRFRRWTLILLALTGANLVRLALAG